VGLLVEDGRQDADVHTVSGWLPRSPRDRRAPPLRG
jgi:hypothetical protein